jgi:hypothetical protein
MNRLPERGAIPEAVNLRLESRMREIRPSGLEGGAAQTNAPSLPLSDCLPSEGESDANLSGEQVGGVGLDEFADTFELDALGQRL